MIPLIKSLIWVSNYPCQWRVKCIPERQGKTEWNIVNNEVKGAWVEIVLPHSEIHCLHLTGMPQNVLTLFKYEKVVCKMVNFNIRQSWDLAIQVFCYSIY